MNRKVIMGSDALPQVLQSELASMQKALEKKYGVEAHMLGTMLENMAQVCNMVRSNLTAEEKEAAYERSREVCADILNVLGRTLNVSRESAIAVAVAYRDFGQRCEEEILGATVLDEKQLQADAAAVIAKAARH